MKHSIPVPVPVPVPETITVDVLWNYIQDNNIKPRPFRYAIERAFDGIMVVAGTRSIEDIVISLVQGEAQFKKCNSKSSDPVSLDIVYDGLTECKLGLFPGHKLPSGTKYGEIADIYYLQRFVAKYGLPPYVEGKINMPERKSVKRPKEKLQHNCPNCGYLLTGKR